MSNYIAERYPLPMECPECGMTMRPVHKHRVPDMPRFYFCTFCDAMIPEDHPGIRFREPARDYTVSKAAYDQAIWERDIAISQLQSIDKGLGEKMNDVAKIVRCKDCMWRGNRWTGCPKLHGLVTPDDFYCGFGEHEESTLFDSLKRGLEEAIAYERGELALHTKQLET